MSIYENLERGRKQVATKWVMETEQIKISITLKMN